MVMVVVEVGGGGGWGGGGGGRVFGLRSERRWKSFEGERVRWASVGFLIFFYIKHVCFK